MKVLLLNGSPHRDGCTATALKEMAKEFDKKILNGRFIIYPTHR